MQMNDFAERHFRRRFLLIDANQNARRTIPNISIVASLRFILQLLSLSLNHFFLDIFLSPPLGRIYNLQQLTRTAEEPQLNRDRIKTKTRIGYITHSQPAKETKIKVQCPFFFKELVNSVT